MRKPKKKIGVIIFHKKIKEIYRMRWIEKCLNSILNQTNQEFKIYEIDYSGDNFSIIKDLYPKFRRHKFISEIFSNHAEAMNRIIDIAFSDGCEYIFNTNVDDYYSLDRIEKQMEYLKNGYDVVSSNFCYITEEENEDRFICYKNVKGNIHDNFKMGHNIIAHPVVAFNKRFWETNRYNPQEIPKEDFLLWYRGIESGFKFYIHDDILLNYRLHENQITGNNTVKNVGDNQFGNKKEKEEKMGPEPSGLRNTRYDF